jgi:GWxTD domain-containing protein
MTPRSRALRRVLLLPVAAALLASAPDGLAARRNSLHRQSDAPTPEWREGPVRYIITKSEDEEYKQLESEEARQRAIESFWRRRDPTPETPGNEFRSRFWRRVRDANRLYGRDTTKPGWLTDMGKIHVLFGPPDEISRDEMAAGRRGIIVWTYRNTPIVGGKDPVLAGPNQVVAFAQDGSGEYRLTTEPSKVADVWEGLPDPQPPMGYNKQYEAQQRFMKEAFARMIGLTDPVIRAHGGPATGGPLGLSMTLSRLQQPPREWELTSEITTREFFGSLPFRARAEFFKSSDEREHVVLTVALRSSSVTYRQAGRGEEPSVQVFARILDSTTTEMVHSLESIHDFVPAPENTDAGLDDDLLFQARAALAPGAYVARLTVLDEVSGRSSTSDTPFTVPDFGEEGLQLSSISLARSIQSDDGEAPPGPLPYRFGTLRVVPRLAHTFLPGEELAFYYQVYGAQRAPESGEPDLDVSYLFLLAEGEEFEEIGRIGFENQRADAHGYALALAGWPAGQYLVRVEVKDNIAAHRTSRELGFRIIEDS